MVADCRYNHHRDGTHREPPESARAPLPRARARDGLERRGAARWCAPPAGSAAVRRARRARRDCRSRHVRRRRERLQKRHSATGARVLRVADQVLAAISPVRQPSGIVAIARCPSATLAQALDRSACPRSSSDRRPGRGQCRRHRPGRGRRAAPPASSAPTAPPTRSAGRRCAARMGSTFRMPIAVRQPLTAHPRRALRSRGLAVIATVPRGGTSADAADLRGPAAALLGGEGAGLPTRSGCVGGRAAHDPHARRLSNRSTSRSPRR